MEIDNDLRTGLMQKISKGVKSRKKGQALRVIYDADMPRDLLKRVTGKLNIDKLDTIMAAGRYQNHKDLMSFPDCGRSDLKYPRWQPLHETGTDGRTVAAAGCAATRPLYLRALPRLCFVHSLIAGGCSS